MDSTAETNKVDRQMAQVRDTFATFLESRHKRRTPERFFILETATSLKGHFTADKLLQECEKGKMRVSRATLFNTLNLLLEAGVLRRLTYHRVVGYEVAAKQTIEPRQNLVCTVCGRIQRRKAPQLRQWVEHQHYTDFAPSADGVELYVYGECSRCRRLRRTSASK
jgi:Fur family ferric uptake transcriptional regulator